MSHSGLRKFIRIGQQADPVILDALSREAPADFKPALRYHFEVAGEKRKAVFIFLNCGAAGGREERGTNTPGGRGRNTKFYSSYGRFLYFGGKKKEERAR